MNLNDLIGMDYDKAMYYAAEHGFTSARTHMKDGVLYNESPTYCSNRLNYVVVDNIVTQVFFDKIK